MLDLIWAIAYDGGILAVWGGQSMSLAELIPLVNNLDQVDQLSLFKFLATKIPNAELEAIFSAPEYPVWSPYDATEAASIMLQMIQDNQDISTDA